MDKSVVGGCKRQRLVKHRRKNWRKTDVAEIEKYLDDRRLEERTGGIRSDQPDSGLFRIDKSGEKVDGSSSSAELRGLLPLKNTSSIPAFVSRKGPVLKKRRATKRKLPAKVTQLASSGGGLGDIWEMRTGDVLRRGLGDQVLDEELQLHGGVSYNPDKGEHERYLGVVGERERKAESRRLKQSKWAKKLKLSNWKAFVREMREGLPDGTDKKPDESEEETSEVGKTSSKRKQRLKTEKQKTRLKMTKLEARRRLRQKAEVKRMTQFGRIKQFKREIEQDEIAREERRVKRGIEMAKGKTRRLGRTRYLSPARTDYKVPSEIGAGTSLRTLQPEGDPLREKYKSFQKRNMIAPPSNTKVPKKRGRYKKVPRR